jgi:hypothetical protein
VAIAGSGRSRDAGVAPARIDGIVRRERAVRSGRGGGGKRGGCVGNAKAGKGRAQRRHSVRALGRRGGFVIVTLKMIMVIMVIMRMIVMRSVQMHETGIDTDGMVERRRDGAVDRVGACAGHRPAFFDRLRVEETGYRDRALLGPRADVGALERDSRACGERLLRVLFDV